MDSLMHATKHLQQLFIEINGDIEINLVASKTRVAPIKRQSIPRLELLGATILVKLVKSVKEAMSSLKTPPEVFLWSDSYTVLCWIRNDKTWKPYVQNRVKEIRELFDREKWRFCPGEINIADLPSRGCSAEELVRNHSWWKGPEFLNHSPEYWPQEPQQSYIDNQEKALAEIKKTSPTIVYSMANPSINNNHESFDIGDIIDINRYSTKLKLLRVTATVIRYAKRWRNPRHKFESAELTAQELQEAEMRWIQTVQEHELQHELSYLIGMSKTPTPVVSQLGLFRDDDGLIRYDGGIGNSSQQKESKQPILLPATHYFTELLIKEQHEVRISYALTPSHLIHGRQISSAPNDKHYEIISTNQSLTKRAKYLQRVLNQFIKQLRTEYLLNLRESSKSIRPNSNVQIAVGDTVILRTDNTRRTFWKLAKVEMLLPSSDGTVRSAKVMVNGESGKRITLRRPIQHLIPLEVKASATDDSCVQSRADQQNTEIKDNDQLQGRTPRRKAAVVGEIVRRQLSS
ncbi:Hypothetical predicted protein [Paramuricea clavata]|uniref:Uncharacterized protein n=1 Tax=Paramuricea clavata TaxID=317549 RepID=A0A7D9IN92_PARCT|nr:Hypothetical predicted protein [Paramuricea clavata]